MGYKEVFDAFSNKHCRQIDCNPKCSIELTEEDKKEYEECAEIDHNTVYRFLFELTTSKCIKDSEKIQFYNFILKRVMSASCIERICCNPLTLDCLIVIGQPFINNANLKILLKYIDRNKDLLPFCLSKAPIDKNNINVYMDNTFKRNYNGSLIIKDDSFVKNQIIIDEITKTILGDLTLVNDVLFRYICCCLDVYWNVFDIVVNQDFPLTSQHYSLILTWTSVETIEKVIQKNRFAITNEHFKELILPSQLNDACVLSLYGYYYNHKLPTTNYGVINKIKLLQKYGYVVTNEDWIFALRRKIVLDSVDFTGDENLFKICTDMHFFPELKWNSVELKKRYELGSLINEGNTAKLKTWIKKNNYVPDENAMIYFGTFGKNLRLLAPLVQAGGKVTANVLHQTAMGEGTKTFIRGVAKHYTPN